jgi:hypothetical protein
MRRRVVHFVAIALVALACSACRLDINIDVAMTADGSGTVTVSGRADPELVAKAPSAFADVRLDDVRHAGWQVSDPAKAADGSISLTMTKPFSTPDEATAILAELNGPGGPLRGLSVRLDRSFAHVASGLTGEAELTGGLGAFSDSALAQAVGSEPLAGVVTQPVSDVLGLTVTARLPGRVVSANGDIAESRDSVSWRPSLADGSATAMSAQFELIDQGARDARRNSRLAWGALAVYLAVILAVVLAVIVVMRRRSGARRATG